MDDWFMLLVGDLGGNCIGHASGHTGSEEMYLPGNYLSVCQVL